MDPVNTPQLYKVTFHAEGSRSDMIPGCPELRHSKCPYLTGLRQRVEAEAWKGVWVFGFRAQCFVCVIYIYISFVFVCSFVFCFWEGGGGGG